MEECPTPEGDLQGRSRFITLMDDKTLTETLLSSDAATRTATYCIHGTSGGVDWSKCGFPFQYDKMTVTYKAEDNGDGTTTISWWGRGNLATEADSEIAAKTFTGFFDLFTMLHKAKFPGN